MSCGARFYDLNKKPIICPSCGTEFTGEIKVKTRRGRLPADEGPESQVEAEGVADEAEELVTEEIETEEGVVSLDDLEEDDTDGDDEDIALDDDLDIDEDLEDLDDEDIDEDIAEEDEDDAK